MSGIMRQSPRFRRILSAAGVVGPFAASAMILFSGQFLHVQPHLSLDLARVLLVDGLLTGGRDENVALLVHKVLERLEGFSPGNPLMFRFPACTPPVPWDRCPWVLKRAQSNSWTPTQMAPSRWR
ncbi:hypothetical protein L596_013506 [Steinernema carpocapsae]|uniref:Uncharacterized protein n=1 Tax=Steinernema carpocapsae TaxID=34508 RepID=A0A4U5P0F2_STECR|nr:hypothetical protein L596_013506 [Steinernema carpocapsae]